MNIITDNCCYPYQRMGMGRVVLALVLFTIYILSQIQGLETKDLYFWTYALVIFGFKKKLMP